MEIKKLKKSIQLLGIQAKDAANLLANFSEDKKNSALRKLKENLKIFKNELLDTNKKDIENARNKNLSKSLIDRLTLTSDRIDDILSYL